MQPTNICANCTFFIWTVGNRGECRRYPPEPVPNGDGRRFTIVLMSDWCGEWAKKP